MRDSVKSDEEVIGKVLAGDVNEFQLLVEKYKNLVFNFSLRLTNNFEDADDLSQDTFVKAYRFLHKYSPEFKFSTWLFKINVNLFRDRFKKKRVSQVPVDELDGRPRAYGNGSGGGSADDGRGFAVAAAAAAAANAAAAGAGGGLEDDVVNRARAGFIRDLISSLPETFKIIINLYFYDEYSYEEIADILKIPVGTVKSRLNRAKLYLVGKYGSFLKKWGE